MHAWDEITTIMLFYFHGRHQVLVYRQPYVFLD